MLHSQVVPGLNGEKLQVGWGPFDSIYFMQPRRKNDSGGEDSMKKVGSQAGDLSLRLGNFFVSNTNVLKGSWGIFEDEIKKVLQSQEI